MQGSNQTSYFHAKDWTLYIQGVQYYCLTVGRIKLYNKAPAGDFIVLIQSEAVGSQLSNLEPRVTSIFQDNKVCNEMTI